MRKLILTFITFLSFQFSNAQDIELKSIPDFSFIKVKGEGIFSNKDLKKGNQTLIAYFSPECIHCVIAIQHLNANRNLLKSINTVLITEYEKEQIINFLKKNALELLNQKNVEVLFDSEYEFSDIFKPESVPYFYLFDKDQKLKTIKIGSKDLNDIFDYIDK